MNSFESEEERQRDMDNHGEIEGIDSFDVNHKRKLSKKGFNLLGTASSHHGSANEDESPTKMGDKTTLSLASRRKGTGAFLHITVEALNTGDSATTPQQPELGSKE